MTTTTTNSSNNIAVKFGLIGFVIYLIAQIIYWQVDLQLLLGFVPNLVGLLVFILCIIAQVQTKKAQGGFITYGNALKAFVLAAAIALLGNYLTQILIYNVIDTEAAATVTDMSIEQSKEAMAKVSEWMGTDSGDFDDAMEQMEGDDKEMFNPLSTGKLIFGYFVALVLFTVGGLISSAIIKKNPPQEWD